MAARAKAIAVQWDGSRKTMTTPAGAFYYAYDAVGRMSSLANPFSETTNWYYQANGWLLGQTLANGATAAYTYNPRGFLTTLNNEQSLGGGQTYSDFDGPTGRMTYDAAGNRLTLRATGDPASNPYPGSQSWQYDTKDQLTTETNTRITSANYTHAYDNAGNATTLRSAPGIPYNNDNQRIGPETYHYDGNGNTDILRGVSLQYDAENRLTSYNGTSLAAAYNGDGLRAWKQTASGRTWFLYDGYDIVCELNNSGNVTATNTIGANGLISRHTSAGSVFYTFDPQGNVAQRLDASGAVLSSDLYDAYGNKLSGNPNGDPCGYGAQWGYYTDAATGLILCTFRYYDPQNARWLTRDPIGYSGSTNLYAYVENRPVILVDPTGLKPWDWIDCMAKCIKDNDPMNHIPFGKACRIANECLGAPIPKPLWRAVGGRVIMQPGASTFTTPPSCLSSALNMGGRSVLRKVGTANFWAFVTYGDYMALVESKCLYDCLRNPRSHQ